MKREHTDLLIIGSGFGGAVAARRLSGLGRVLLLEKGGHWHPDDFRQNGDPRYMADLFDLHTGTGVGILSGSGLGGSSLVYSQVSVRTPSEAFELRDQEGIRLWPEGFSAQPTSTSPEGSAASVGWRGEAPLTDELTSAMPDQP